MEREIAFADIGALLSQKRKNGHFLGLSRLLVFVGLLVTFVLGVAEASWIFLAFMGLLFLFFRLVIAFQENKDWIHFLGQLLLMESEQRLRAERQLNSFDPGTEYLDKSHPFANDLDLFGQHSLFQLTNHTVNKAGRDLLAAWMKEQLDPLSAQGRQKAIQELKSHPGFIRNYEGIGRAFLKGEKSKQPFYRWLSEHEPWQAWYHLPTMLGPIGGLAIMILTLFGLIPAAWLGIWILMGMGFMSLIFFRMKKASESMPNLSDLKTFRKWVVLLENSSFQDPYLLDLQRPFLTGEIKGSKILQELEQKTFVLQNRYNLMYLLANLFFWLDFALYFRALRWKNTHGHLMADWERKFDEWQVMVSLAAFSTEENLVNLPTWTDGSYITAQGITHPLLRRDIAVGNDFLLGKDTKTILLTGSNMSGKTTFMRTLGINMVLANLGLGIFGEKFQIGSFLLFTSMRNTDSLGESVSSFYAELGRIKHLLGMASNGQKAFYLLDEILKGTNTTDRIMGSEALIRQLAGSKCKGIISTHDIELSELQGKLAYLVNKSFHSQILEDRIHFDYTLKEGPCPSFNAHKLMELMGIKFEE